MGYEANGDLDSGEVVVCCDCESGNTYGVFSAGSMLPEMPLCIAFATEFTDSLNFFYNFSWQSSLV